MPGFETARRRRQLYFQRLGRVLKELGDADEDGREHLRVVRVRELRDELTERPHDRVRDFLAAAGGRRQSA
jgi:hypothetical protein|eukprot:4148-Pelagococcus_subviridis.AAC.1